MKFVTFDFGVLQPGVDVYDTEHLNDVIHATSELLQLAEDEHFREVEAPVTVCGIQSFLGVMKRLLILADQLQTAGNTADDHG